MRRVIGVATLVLLAGCAPQVAGQQVGQALYNASIGTGNALANFGDRTGVALQTAGTRLRTGIAAQPAPDEPPPVYNPDGSSRFDPSARTPVQSEPLD